jgi:ACR3 family arsenite efflux pump ArsB
VSFEFDPEKLMNSHFVVGALGALVGLKFAPGTTWRERAINVSAGMLCAGYFAPALAEWFHVASPGMQSALAFAVGMFGLSLAAAVAQALRELKLGEIISGWLSRRG